MTIVSFRWYNILLSLFGAVSWLMCWRFIAGSAPTWTSDATTNSTITEWAIYLTIGMAIVTMLVYFGRRNRALNGASGTNGIESWLPQQRQAPRDWSNDLEDYRRTVHKALHQEREKR